MMSQNLLLVPNFLKLYPQSSRSLQISPALSSSLQLSPALSSSLQLFLRAGKELTATVREGMTTIFKSNVKVGKWRTYNYVLAAGGAADCDSMRLLCFNDGTSRSSCLRIQT